MSGWFAVKRGITTHPLFKGRPDRLAVWLWLLDNAAWTETEHDIQGKLVTIKPGQVAVSQRRMEAETGVGRQVIRTFLSRLELTHMVTRDLTHSKSILTLCNWAKYQEPKNATNPPSNPLPNPELTHDQPTKEQGNKIDTLEPNGSKGAGAPNSEVEVSVLQKAVWDQIPAYLERHGVAAKQARSVTGRWLKSHGASQLLEVGEKAQRSGTDDPIPYITELLKGENKFNGQPKLGDTKTRADGTEIEFQGPNGWVEVHA